MSNTFIDAVAETREAFLDLVRNATLTFYELYAGTPSAELEALFSNVEPDELFLRFDMQQHSEIARNRFCGIDELTRRAHNFPENMSIIPLPCFKSFIVPLGSFGKAWTMQEVCELILEARNEKVIAKRAALVVKPRGNHPKV